MVRQCCVGECKESDVTILAHRFPKLADVSAKWRNALDLHNITVDDLQKRYVVCTKHFTASSYRNRISNSLNKTATPNLDDNSTNHRVLLKGPAFRQKKEESIKSRLFVQPKIVLLKNKPLQQTVHPNNRFLPSEKDECQEMHDLTYEEHLVTIDMEDDDQPEVFESYTVEKTTKDEMDDEEKEEETNEKSDRESTQYEPDEIKITFSNRETQTDQIEEKIVTMETPISIAQPQQSKDDKIIKILYPEFEGMTKIKLIELVSEKNQRIETLEDKVKKLEQAMRSFL